MSETITGSRGEHVVPGAVWRNKRESWRRVTITDVSDGDLGPEPYVNVLRSTSRRRQAIKVSTLLRSYAFERMEVERDASELAVYYSGSDRGDRFFLAPAGLGISDALTHRKSDWYKTRYGAEQALDRARRSS